VAEHPEVDVRHIRGDGTVFSAKSILVSVDKPSAEQLAMPERVLEKSLAVAAASYAAVP
jgi:hypothetical protein